MSFEVVKKKVYRRLKKMRYKSIRVFFFHQVSDFFDPNTMLECDWTATDTFKANLLMLKEHYSFIALDEACNHLKKDLFRRKSYAVLTCDDGGRSLLNIIPWIVQEQIPITLFLNPECMELPQRGHLSKSDVDKLVRNYSPYISLASHGWNHIDSSKMSIESFCRNVDIAEKALSIYRCKIPFYAFPYGKYTKEEICLLGKEGLVPVLADGQANYDDCKVIHRECIDQKYFIRLKFLQ